MSYFYARFENGGLWTYARITRGARQGLAVEKGFRLTSHQLADGHL